MLFGIGGLAVLTGGYACPIHSLTGLYCPGCGLTRALLAVVHLHLLTALHDNLMLFVAPILMLVGTRLDRKSAPLRVSYALACVLLVVTYTVFRNQPNSPLAPL